MTLAPSLFLSLAACSGQNQFTFAGSPVWKLFPFDGQRTWEYISTDESLSYKLVASSILEPEVVRNKNVYTVDYAVECVRTDPECVTGTLLRQLRWSSTVTDGVLVHGWSVDGGPLADYDPPVRITADMAERDDVFVTESGGITWISTVLGVDECPIHMNAAWDECTMFEVAADVDGDGAPDEGEGYPLAGTYWMTQGNGTAALEIVGDSGQWQLSDLGCEGECDGSW